MMSSLIKYLLFTGIIVYASHAERDNNLIATTNYSNETTLSRGYIKLQTKDLFNDTVFFNAYITTTIKADQNISDIIEITSDTTAYVSLLVEHPTLAKVTINELTFQIIVIPNDSVNIVLIGGNPEPKVSFEGEYAVINNYLLSRLTDFGYLEIIQPLNESLSSRSKYNKVLEFTDSIKNTELTYLDRYISNHPIPDWFYFYMKAEIEYLASFFKLLIVKANPINKVFKDSVPKTYYSFLEKVSINNPTAVFSNAYFNFLDQYLTANIPKSKYDKIGGLDRALVFYTWADSLGSLYLSDEPLRYYRKYMFVNICAFTSNKSILDSIGVQWKLNDSRSYIEAFSRNDFEEMKSSNKDFRISRGDEIQEFFLTDMKDSLVSIRDFSDKIVFLNIWATWCGPCIKHFPDFNKSVMKYKSNNNIVFVSICLDSKKARWRQIVEKEKLNGVVLFAEGNWNQKIKDQLNLNQFPNYIVLSSSNRYVACVSDFPSASKLLDREVAKSK